MNKFKLILLTALIMAFAAGSANAASVILFDPANSGIDDATFNVVISGYTIDIYETWDVDERGFLEFRGLEVEKNYTIIKHITNNTSLDWTSFTNELLDPAGQNEDGLDPQPYEAWVSATGYTTSNDDDGLSFAQGSGIPRTSNAYSSLYVDELFHKRDFLEFSAGTIAGGGGTDVMSFGIRDNGFNTNQPFLLAQSPNERIIPEPATMILLGTGLLGAGFMRRRKAKK